MEEPKRRGGCRGCGITLLVLLLLIGVVVAIRWGALEKLGLRKPIAEQVFAPPPDRAASTAMMEALNQAGINTQGVGVHVLPMAGQAGSVALMTLDASQGFDPERFVAGEGDWDALEQVLNASALQDANITRLAFDYVDKDSKSIVTLTAPVEALRQLGEDDLDQKEFLSQVMGRIDIPRLIQEMTP